MTWSSQQLGGWGWGKPLTKCFHGESPRLGRTGRKTPQYEREALHDKLFQMEDKLKAIPLQPGTRQGYLSAIPEFWSCARHREQHPSVSYSITMTFPHGKHSYRELLTSSVHPDQQDDVRSAHGVPLPTTSPQCCLRSWDTKPQSASSPTESSLSSIQKFTSVLTLSLSSGGPACFQSSLTS